MNLFYNLKAWIYTVHSLKVDETLLLLLFIYFFIYFADAKFVVFHG